MLFNKYIKILKTIIVKCKPLIWFVLMLFVITSCKNSKQKSNANNIGQIVSQGKLRAITDYNSTSYFVYRGTPMGFQYDLLKKFATHLNLELELTVVNDIESAFDKLTNNKCDILAINLNVTNQRKNFVAFTEPLLQTRQMLVQKMPDNWQRMSSFNIDKQLIRNHLDLAEKNIHVVKNSAYAYRLKYLMDEIGDTINIIEVENYDAEQLLTLVAQGEIDYTVVDENIAILNQSFYPNIDALTPISFNQNQSWAVNLDSEQLLAELNNWINQVKNTNWYKVTYNKYFKDMRFAVRGTSNYSSIAGGKISEYDILIKKYSATINWDWRLLASLIYQESRFKHDAKSWAGAFGLMQLMPETAARFGVDENSDPELNIIGGTKLIAWLDKQFENVIADKNERVKFILASYNIGIGHVLDAQRLAAANNKDPNIWDNNVDFFLLNKSNPEYYNPELVKHGYCRGIETYNYVKDIIERYNIYKGLIK